MAKEGCFTSNYFLILVLIVFFMLLYVYATPRKVLVSEAFVAETGKLIPADKLVVIQGNGIPDVPIQASVPDSNDPSAHSVDGTLNGPRSLFTFAYNECKPECCQTSGGYSCNGGCPCLTDEQKNFMFNKCKKP